MKGIKIFFRIFFLVFLIGLITLPFRGSSARRPADRYKKTIAFHKSRYDQDADGIDDRSDLLEGALEYVATRPRYKSSYFQGGYPDDGTGVCTDVVAQAFLHAGYDLMYMVYDDICQHPDEYGITTADVNIDFRRVSNLEVFCNHYMKKMTTDIYDIENWQGGDIVIFDEHIGIVSDRRNGKGIPYVIHHNSSFQRSYEEDILENRRDLQSHYRIS